MAAEFDNDRDDVIRRALDVGVAHMITIGYDLQSSLTAVSLSERWDAVHAAVGIHPCYVHEARDSDYREIEKMFDHSLVVGVGETGIDLYHDSSTFPLQKTSFRRHMEWSQSMGLPVIIHDRNAHVEVMAMLEEFSGSDITAILHCFTGDNSMAEKAISMGCFLGVGGIATFKNSSVRKVVSNFRKDRILLETDAPYLAPVPHRGRRNEPAYLVNIVDAVAQSRDMTIDELARNTTENAKRVFRLY